ncbi:FecR family protein [Olivibacter sp. XZL3]|uniref:FecR family protein n=1 Tax=Olivibacter sp. XZL3 TaxID=1735116 RepID=UPI001066D40C|nr:FecR family protein [Olivibacter sp. XZL3]
MKAKKQEALKRLFYEYERHTLDKQRSAIIDDWFETGDNDVPEDIFRDANTERRIYTELKQRLKTSIAVTPVRRLPIKSWLKVACIFLLVAAAIIPLSTLFRSRPLQVVQQSYQTIATGGNEFLKVSMDGTTIWLSPSTTLRLPKYRLEKEQTVFLDKGEAFFEVRHDNSRLFKVVTGDLITRDIGTAFNIQAYEPQTEYRVSVASGEVDVCRVLPDGNLQVVNASLRKGAILTYHPTENKTTVLKSAEEIVPRVKNKTPLQSKLTIHEIGKELGRHFQMEVTVNASETDTARYTLHLANQSLFDVLNQLTTTAGITYSIDHNQLTLNAQNSSMK